MRHDLQQAQAALDAYDIQATAWQPIIMGSIHETYELQTLDGKKFIFQRVNPMFHPHIHLDIETISRHLQNQGMQSPELVLNRDGKLWTTDAEGRIWRVLTFIEGVVHERATQDDLCYAAGCLLGKFHKALLSLPDRPFAAPPFNIHDTKRHLQLLRDTLQTHSHHVAYAQVVPLASHILQLSQQMSTFEHLPSRVVHGDPKLNNLVFTEHGTGVAMIDLDTIGRMNIALELGDALRSWCNPQGESQPYAAFSLDFFNAALTGYAEGSEHMLIAAEIATLPRAIESIALELAARFCTDVLKESYFAWDPTRYEAAWQHHLVRTQSQLSLALFCMDLKKQLEMVVENIFMQPAA